MSQERTKQILPSVGRYYLLYIPWLLAMAFSTNATTSFITAWLGSFFIFYISFTNKVKPTSPDVRLAEKILKPVFLTQAIFAGYMSATSIFYFMDIMGYQYFARTYGIVPDPNELALAAACQRYYVLGHAAMVHGILLFYKSDIQSRYSVHIKNWPSFCLRLALIAAPIGFVCSRIGGLSVLGVSIEGIALVAATIAFALAIPMRQTALIAGAGALYMLQIARALTSGFKEPVIVSVLMLGIFLFPFYKRLITLTFIPLMIFLFAVLPTYVNTFRSQQNSAADAETAKEEALKKVREGLAGDELANTNWDFLTDRISEIGMFVKYKENTDLRNEYYGTTILAQSAIALVPRLFWPGKPLIENMVTVRVLENGIMEEHALTSAKPQYIVDGFLTAGGIGVWVALFFYGAFAQWMANACERYFGGYLFGLVIIYTGVFRFMWRGNCFEYIFNNMVYGSLLLIALFHVFRRLNILSEVK